MRLNMIPLVYNIGHECHVLTYMCWAWLYTVGARVHHVKKVWFRWDQLPHVLSQVQGSCEGVQDVGRGHKDQKGVPVPGFPPDARYRHLPLCQKGESGEALENCAGTIIASHIHEDLRPGFKVP
jgi:hypothetical protein